MWRKNLKALRELQNNVVDSDKWRQMYFMRFLVQLHYFPVRRSFFTACKLKHLGLYAGSYWILPPYEKSNTLKKGPRQRFQFPSAHTDIIRFYLTEGRQILLNGRLDFSGDFLVNDSGKSVKVDQVTDILRKFYWECLGQRLNMRDYRFLFAMATMHSDMPEKHKIFISQQLRHTVTTRNRYYHQFLDGQKIETGDEVLPKSGVFPGGRDVLSSSNSSNSLMRESPPVSAAKSGFRSTKKKARRTTVTLENLAADSSDSESVVVDSGKQGKGKDHPRPAAPKTKGKSAVRTTVSGKRKGVVEAKGYTGKSTGEVFPKADRARPRTGYPSPFFSDEIFSFKFPDKPTEPVIPKKAVKKQSQSQVKPQVISSAQPPVKPQVAPSVQPQSKRAPVPKSLPKSKPRLRTSRTYARTDKQVSVSILLLFCFFFCFLFPPLLFLPFLFLLFCFLF